jgi:uncharacterized membrane protein YhhN
MTTGRDGPRAATAALVAAALAAAALTIAGKTLGIAWLVWTFKPLSTATIIAIAWRRSDDRYGRAIRLGLALSLLGDVLLIPEGFFVAGLIAFLCAHLAYLRALTVDTRLAARRLPFAVVALVAVAILAMLWPTLPTGLRLPVIGYVAVLGAMCAQALARAMAVGTTAARVAAIGAVLFLTSDALLAFDRFHTRFDAAPLLVLGTYYVAQLLLALSIEPMQSDRADR